MGPFRIFQYGINIGTEVWRSHEHNNITLQVKENIGTMKWMS